MTNDQVKLELEKIQLANGGVLSPVAVVDHARNTNHPLHNRFEWDDTKAAELHRIEQARGIIRAVVTVVKNACGDVTTRAFVSLSTHKGTTEPYISIGKAIKSRPLRDVLLDDAKRDADSFARKYSVLDSLKPVFGAMRKAKLIA